MRNQLERNTKLLLFSIITTEKIMKQVVLAGAIALMASGTAFAQARTAERLKPALMVVRQPRPTAP
jgi:hypothetical protein